MRLAASAAFVLALAACPASAATFYVTTGLGNQTSTIDADHPVTWGFVANSTFSHIAGGVFAMKYDGSTTAGIKLEILTTNSEVLASASYADVLSYIADGGSSDYDRFVFTIDAIGYALQNGEYYIVQLSLAGVDDPTGQSYSVQGFDGDITLAIDDPENIVVTYAGTNTVATPEPATALIFGAGLLGLGACRRSRCQGA